MGEEGDRGRRTQGDNEFKLLRMATLTLSSNSLADGPSSNWLFRHFPWYRLEDDAKQLQSLTLSALSPTTACEHVHTPAQTSRTKKRASAITIGYALLTVTLEITLVHANQNFQLRQSAHRCRLFNIQPQSPRYASPTVAIGHHRCSPFFELHNFGSGTPLTSVGTTPRQLLAQRGQLAHTFTAKIRQIFDVVLFRHAEHAKTFLRGFTPAILHRKTFRLFRALQFGLEMGNLDSGPSGLDSWLPGLN